jgi:hypothetical protein
MTEPLSFDSNQDPELGARLRDALDGPDPELFLARMRHAVSTASRETTWDVLSRWAPAGLVAATAAAVIFWLVIGRSAVPNPATQFMASAPARMEIAPSQPEADVLVTSVLEGR